MVYARAVNATGRLNQKRGKTIVVRMSILRNYPVICGKKQLGLLQNVSIDAAQKRFAR